MTLTDVKAQAEKGQAVHRRDVKWQSYARLRICFCRVQFNLIECSSHYIWAAEEMKESMWCYRIGLITGDP